MICSTTVVKKIWTWVSHTVRSSFDYPLRPHLPCKVFVQVVRYNLPGVPFPTASLPDFILRRLWSG